MNDIEIRMVEELQKYLDEVKNAQDEYGLDSYSRGYWSERFIKASTFVEAVTGKTVESGGWNVRLVERREEVEA